MLAEKDFSFDIVTAARSDKYVPNSGSTDHANAESLNGASGTNSRPLRSAGSHQYSIPAPYRELLDRVNDVTGGSAEARPKPVVTANLDDSVGLMPESVATAHMNVAEVSIPDQSAPAGKETAETFSFWPAVRKLAKRRLDSKEPDVEPWQHRAARFHESLWVEELRLALDMVDWRFTASALPMVGEGLHTLDITPLSDIADVPLESVLRGVNVHLQCSGGSTYRAMVQPGSAAGSLLLSSSASLARAKGPFKVQFHPNRFQQVAMHRALADPQNSDFLRTASDELALSASTDAVEETANTLPASLNDDQRRAVAGVLAQSSKRPLVIWGPPGTGKSTLAAFVIWHLVQQRPNNLHILVAAPSNTGADVLCKKLVKLGLDSKQVLRLNALGRNVGTVSEDLRPFCFYKIGENGRPTFGVPPLSEARQFKVIVTTCIAAAHLVNAVRSEGSGGWFSHVILDEAGEATEPETLVPLSLLRKVAGAAVLLGDHFQLGPLVISRLASQLASLEISTIERLANERFSTVRDGEERAGLSRDTLLACEDHGLFFLTESYRSHPAITALYSKIFYASQLQHSERAQQFAALPFFAEQGFSVPIIFHNVVGKECRDPDSPSVYNIEELRIVQQYVVDMLAHESLGLRSSDVGVITPYTKQLQTLQKQFDSLGPDFSGVECGTVEWFQGQERNIIIMSTVRCSKLADGSVAPSGDNRRPIGFVADPKRLNVAISRAVAGLIIVGDFHTLANHSAHWRQLLEMAKEMSCLVGEPLTDGRVLDSLPVEGQQLEKTEVPAAQASAAWDALTSG